MRVENAVDENQMLLSIPVPDSCLLQHKHRELMNLTELDGVADMFSRGNDIPSKYWLWLSQDSS